MTRAANKPRTGWAVLFGRPRPGSAMRQENGRASWRAVFRLADRGNMALPIPFSTRADAEACCAIMRASVPSPELMTSREFAEKFASLTGSLQETCDMLVAQSCRW